MITIEAGVLARAMKHAAGIVATRNTIPILSNVRLHAQGEGLQITTSDLDVEFQQTLPLAVGGDLATTVDARRLFALASASDAGSQISMSLEDGRLTVKSGRSRWVLPVLPVDDFPTIPFDGREGELTIDGGKLATALDRVMWSVSTEDGRYWLHGPLFHAEDGKAALVTTNGHTCARIVTDHAFPDDAPEVIIGPKFARSLTPLIAEIPEVELAWDPSKIRATFGQVQLTGKVIDGTFPDYRRILPRRADEPVTIDPANLRAALRRVQLVSTEKTRAVKWEGGDGKLTLSVAGIEAGTACEEMPASCTAAPATGFNAQYLDRMAEAVGGDTIAMHQADAADPALFERTVPDGMLCVVMPMRV